MISSGELQKKNTQDLGSDAEGSVNEKFYAKIAMQVAVEEGETALEDEGDAVGGRVAPCRVDLSFIQLSLLSNLVQATIQNTCFGISSDV